MTFTMTQEERETFLAALHVGVLGISAPDRAPVLVPVWYSYEPGGEIVFITNKNAKKAKRLEQEGDLPYVFKMNFLHISMSVLKAQ